MNKRFRTPWNMPELVTPGERNGKPSMTVPGQDISVQELIKRYATGKPLADGREPEYDEDPEAGEIIPGFAKMDKLERIDALRATASELDDLKKTLDAKAARSKKKAELKQIELDLDEKKAKKEEKAGQAIPAVEPEKGGTTV